MHERIGIGSTVYDYGLYDAGFDDWFDQGQVIRIDNDMVHVDMLDWIQGWRLDELEAKMVCYRLVFVPTGPGWLIHCFGQVISRRR